MLEYAAILGILTVVGYWIFLPLFRPKALETVSPKRKENREEALQQRKEEVYKVIKEMDFDYGMGKISEDDYQELKSQYTARAVEILKEFDKVPGEESDIDSAIEREVQQLRQKMKAKGEKGNGGEAVWQINFCPQCGRKAAPNKNFCQGCGMRLIPPGRRD